MKKQIFYLTILSLVICNPIHSQSDPLMFTSFDNAVFDVWQVVYEQNDKHLGGKIEQLNKEWLKTKSSISENAECGRLYCDSFCSDIDFTISVIGTLAESKYYHYIEESILYLTQEFYFLRERYNNQVYLSDLLWQSYKLSFEINEAADDQMLDLLEWNEFENKFCQLQQYWQSYKYEINEINTVLSEQEQSIINGVEASISQFEEKMMLANRKEIIIPASDLKASIATSIITYHINPIEIEF